MISLRMAFGIIIRKMASSRTRPGVHFVCFRKLRECSSSCFAIAVQIAS